jgi:hypothetical protein
MTTYTRPSPHDLLVMVRDVIANRSWVYDQETWTDNAWGKTVGELRAYILRDEHPGSNSCGTTGCVAGLAVMLGDDPRAKINSHGTVRLANGLSVRDIGRRAAELLDLTNIQGLWLFRASRTRDEVLAGLDMLIADPHAHADLYTIALD